MYKKYSSKINKSEVIVDFSIKENYPLVKTKFGVYICTYVSVERMIRDLKILHELRPCGLRYDPGWGWGNDDRLNSPRELGSPQISGKRDDLIINFQNFDKLTKTLHGESIDIMYVHAYNPLPLQNDTQISSKKFNEYLNRYSNWNTKPNDMGAWEKINYEYAKHWRKKGWKVKYYEIWNEPDEQPTFFIGTKEDYFEIYKYGVLGIKSGDPDAMVGGPVVSFNKSWIEPFLDFVKKEGLPLDFFSFHTYGNPSKVIKEIREILKQRPELECTDILITEYNSYIPATRDFTSYGAIERYEAASQLLHDFKFFLTQNDIKSVYWAQYDDPEVFASMADRCGLISLDGKRKAAFNAFKIYADMPVERKCFESLDNRIEGMASSDKRRACTALWNMSDEEIFVNLKIHNTNFKRGNFKLFRIDSMYSSYIDNSKSEKLEVVEEQSGIETDKMKWSGILPGRGAIYIVVENYKNKIISPTKPMKVLKIHKYYNNRGKANYAEFDPNTWTAYLGMVNEELGDSLIGVEIEEIKSELDISVSVDGKLCFIDKNSLVGIRLDYMKKGSYTKSVLFHGGFYNSSRDSKFPWGTKQLPETIVKVSDFSYFKINVASYAPEDWNNRRVIISFEMQNSGIGIRAKMKMS